MSMPGPMFFARRLCHDDRARPAAELRTTLVIAVEVSKTAWIIAAHVPACMWT